MLYIDNDYQYTGLVMKFEKQLTMLRKYVETKKLRNSKQRENILVLFLEQNKHMTVEEVYEAAKEKLDSVGIATIYRCFNLFCDCGLCNVLTFADGVARYEAVYDNQHHDHLMCTECGKLIEITNNEIEDLQNKIALDHGFVLTDHKFELYGVCKSCLDKRNKVKGVGNGNT